MSSSSEQSDLMGYGEEGEFDFGDEYGEDEIESDTIVKPSMLR